LDEAQKIKNPKTKMFVAIKSLKSDFRLALSGTPKMGKCLQSFAQSHVICQNARKFKLK
jgi:SNF2 family DNA or RNA helicase